MLQHEDISKINEIKTFFKDSWLQPGVLSKQINLIKFKQSLSVFKSIKSSGIGFYDIFRVLIFMPMLNSKSVHDVVSSSKDDLAKKDTYYRALSNQKINWRVLLYLVSKQYLNLTKTEPSNQKKCLIFDDTEIEKTGKSIEGISKIHSHVSGRFFFGYKLLVAGYWDGSVFIPLDFSFHRENKNNKTMKYGLNKKQRKNQRSVNRDKSQHARTRFNELNKKKTDVLVEMFKRINKRRIKVDYILVDSWFTSLSLLKRLMSVNSSVDIIGMYKYNSKVIVNGKPLKINQLKKGSQKLKRARSLGMYYKFFDVEIEQVNVRVFLIRRGVNGAWHTIISTNRKLVFTKMIDIYSTRWSIEVFFKETKQLLNLGKNQSTNFDVQIAQTTITMIQYQLLSLKYRMEAYQTIGGMFRDVKQDIIEHKLNERIIAVISEILIVLDFIIDGLDLEETLSKLIHHSDKFTFLMKIEKNKQSYKLVA